MAEHVEHQITALPAQDHEPPIPSAEGVISPSIPSVDDQDGFVSTTAIRLSEVCDCD